MKTSKNLLKSFLGLFFAAFSIATGPVSQDTITLQVLNTSVTLMQNQIPTWFRGAISLSVQNSAPSLIFNQEVEGLIDRLLAESSPDHTNITGDYLYRMVPAEDGSIVVAKSPLEEWVRYISSEGKHRLEIRISDGLEGVMYLNKELNLENPADLKAFIGQNLGTKLTDLLLDKPGTDPSVNMDSMDSLIKRMKAILDTGGDNGAQLFENVLAVMQTRMDENEHNTKNNSDILKVFPSRFYCATLTGSDLDPTTMEKICIALVRAPKDAYPNITLGQILCTNFLSILLGSVKRVTETKRSIDLAEHDFPGIHVDHMSFWAKEIPEHVQAKYLRGLCEYCGFSLPSDASSSTDDPMGQS